MDSGSLSHDGQYSLKRMPFRAVILHCIKFGNLTLTLLVNIYGHMKTSPETRLLNKLKGETMLVAKIILTPESPVEGIEGKRQQQLFPNL